MELNAEQRRAVEAVRGPVCILAGAGSGKTTTITHRVANQVATGAFAPSQLLAVTFTDKAAGEMRARLERLGVTGVRASTFHSAALSQLRYFRPDAVGRILPSKVLVVRNLMNSLPAPYKFRAAGDLATEIEWAQQPADPARALPRLARRPRPAGPAPTSCSGSTARYEEKKRAEGLMDFEDLLERAIEMLRRRARGRRVPRALPRVHGRRVPGRQPAPADAARALARRRATTSASSATTTSRSTGSPARRREYLLGFQERAQVFRLEENYRSTPQVLALANRLVPKLGGAEKTLRAALPDGPEPEVKPFADAGRPRRRTSSSGSAAPAAPLEEIALLCRTHARLADFEAVLHEAGIPSQGAALLTRDAARRLLRVLDDAAPAAERGARRSRSTSAGCRSVRPTTSSASARRRGSGSRRASSGWPRSIGGTGAEFRAELERRFGDGGEARRGVHLLTYHGAKGLEFEVVLLPRLEEKELPVEAGEDARPRSPTSAGSSTSG